MLRRDTSHMDEDHICPHCDQKMSCCEAPQVHIGDGLGWGSDILYICLNDYCTLFLKGWDNIERQYGHHASYRYMELPGSKEGNFMMVGNADAFKASVINPETLKEQNERYQDEKKARADLESGLHEGSIKFALQLILDEAADIEGRKQAISLLPVIDDLNCIDPIRNHEFRDTSLEMECNQVIDVLLKKNYMKECVHCGELVKMQAKKCKHCKEDF